MPKKKQLVDPVNCLRHVEGISVVGYCLKKGTTLYEVEGSCNGKRFQGAVRYSEFETFYKEHLQGWLSLLPPKRLKGLLGKDSKRTMYEQR
jgi:hypothetical protein